MYYYRFSVGSGSCTVLFRLAVGGRSGFTVDPAVFFIILKCNIKLINLPISYLAITKPEHPIQINQIDQIASTQ